MPHRRVAVYEHAVERLSRARGRIDLFWPGELVVEQKSLGKDLFGAEQQALDYLHGLSDAEMPKRVLSCELVGHLHDLLEASGYTGRRLEVFLTRIVFCLFADDTGIFEPRDILWDLLETRTRPDGSDNPSATLAASGVTMGPR